MRIGRISKFIAASYNNEELRKRTIYLKGKSGIGKSDSVKQASDKLAETVPNWGGVIDLRLSQCDQTDLRGLPSVVEGRTSWNPPEFFPHEGTAGILLLDEITSAPPSLQAVAYQLALDHRVGDYHLPAGWMVIAAGNLQSDRGVTFNIAAPLLNRMTEIEVDTVLEDWELYAVNHGIRPDVLAFVHNRADYLHKFDGKVNEQFPTPRGWMAASKHLDMDFGAVASNSEETGAIRLEVLKGDVGAAAAVDFETFSRIYGRIPDIDAIEKDPKGSMVPDAINELHCLMMGISMRLDKKNFAAFHEYLKRMPKEMSTLAVKLAYKRNRDIVQSPAFNEWAQLNAAAFQRT